MNDYPCVNVDPRLQVPFTCIISGPSGCGKTVLVSKMLCSENVFTIKHDKILFFYQCWQPLYEKLLRTIKNISFHNSLPSSFEESGLFNGGGNHLIILDDLMTESVGSLDILKLFTMFRHHKGISVMMLSQNVFMQGKYARTLALNCQYYILFNNPRDRLQIRVLGSQMFPHDPKFLVQAYNDAVRKPYGYLTVDLTQGTPDECRLRGGGLQGVADGDPFPFIYTR